MNSLKMFVLCGLLATLAACETAAPPEPATATPSTPTIDVQIAKAGTVLGSCTIGTTKILFEAIRGGQTAPELREADPNTPDFEIDARFMSSDGHPFMTQLGGHGFMRASWAEDDQVVYTIDIGRRQNELDAAAACADLIPAKLPGSDVQPEANALVNLGHAAISGPMERPPVSKDLSTSGGNFGVASLPLTAFGHKIVLYRGPAVKIFDHTATWTVVTGPISVAARITCNHGNCAGSTGMKVRCSASYANRPTTLPSLGQCGKTTNFADAGTAGCCNSGYNIFYGHVCNSDSKLQLDTVKMYPSACPVAPYCKSADPSWSAPSCK